jgi:hypothetical protein
MATVEQLFRRKPVPVVVLPRARAEELAERVATA